MRRRCFILIVLAALAVASIVGVAQGQQDRSNAKAMAMEGGTREQYLLAVALLKGERVERDLVRGYAWLTVAADCPEFCESDQIPHGIERDIA